MSNITDLLCVHWELCGNRACSYWSMGDNKTGLHCMLEPSAHEMQVSYHHCLHDNMHWWTCVSWAQLCINFEATSLILVSLGAGSSTDCFQIPGGSVALPVKVSIKVSSHSCQQLPWLDCCLLYRVGRFLTHPLHLESRNHTGAEYRYS